VDARGEERVRRQEADQIVSLGTQRLARRLGGHRDGDRQAGWARLANRLDGTVKLRTTRVRRSAARFAAPGT
jgi:hypothetical protein